MILSLKGAERDAALSALLREAATQKDSTRAQAVAKIVAQSITGGYAGYAAAPFSGE